MTNNQRIALQADWWPAACRAQGWKAGDRDLRLRACSWAVSLVNPTWHQLLEAINSDRTPERNLASTSDLDNKADIDRVKSCLGMLADNLKAAGEVAQPAIGRARRLRDVIRMLLRCLALFENHPRRYLATLVADMFNHGRPGITIRDLTDDVNIRANGTEGPSDLDRLVMRMSAVVNQRRNQNHLTAAYRQFQSTEPLTIHQMKMLAKVTCDCADCRRLRKSFTGGPIIKPLPAPEDWSDFDPELESAQVADPELGNATCESENPF